MVFLTQFYSKNGFKCKITQNFDNWINFKIVLTKTEATQAIIFGEEENTRRVYLSGQILSFKHKANILNWAGAKNIKKHWIFSGFAEKSIFLFLIITSTICVLTYHLKQKYHELIKWVWFSSAQDTFSDCSQKHWLEITNDVSQLNRTINLDW